MKLAVSFEENDSQHFWDCTNWLTGIKIPFVTIEQRMEIKKIILWSYERGTWQYDVLCLLIIAFIFLTPSSLFNKPTPKPSDSTLIEQQDAPKSSTANPPQATEKKKRESEKATGKLPVVDK